MPLPRLPKEKGIQVNAVNPAHLRPRGVRWRLTPTGGAAMIGDFFLKRPAVSPTTSKPPKGSTTVCTDEPDHDPAHLAPAPGLVLQCQSHQSPAVVQSWGGEGLGLWRAASLRWQGNHALGGGCAHSKTPIELSRTSKPTTPRVKFSSHGQFDSHNSLETRTCLS